MSKLTKEINKISLAVIGISGRLVFYALVLVLLVLFLMNRKAWRTTKKAERKGGGLS